MTLHEEALSRCLGHFGDRNPVIHRLIRLDPGPCTAHKDLKAPRIFDLLLLNSSLLTAIQPFLRQEGNCSGVPLAAKTHY